MSGNVHVHGHGICYLYLSCVHRICMYNCNDYMYFAVIHLCVHVHACVHISTCICIVSTTYAMCTLYVQCSGHWNGINIYLNSNNYCPLFLPAFSPTVSVCRRCRVPTVLWTATPRTPHKRSPPPQPPSSLPRQPRRRCQPLVLSSLMLWWVTRKE